VEDLVAATAVYSLIPEVLDEARAVRHEA